MAQPVPVDLPSRVLPIYRDSLSHRHINIMDTDKTTVLYTVDTNSGSMLSSKPHMRISRGGGGTVVGSATFHSFSRSVDLEFGASAGALEPAGLLTRSCQFGSSVGPLTWQHDGALGSDLSLVNAEKQWLARFANTMFSWTKEGSLEIAAGVGVGTGLLDEIVVSGMAMLELQRRRKKSRAGGGA